MRRSCSSPRPVALSSTSGCGRSRLSAGNHPEIVLSYRTVRLKLSTTRRGHQRGRFRFDCRIEEISTDASSRHENPRTGGRGYDLEADWSGSGFRVDRFGPDWPGRRETLSWASCRHRTTGSTSVFLMSRPSAPPGSGRCGRGHTGRLLQALYQSTSQHSRDDRARWIGRSVSLVLTFPEPAVNVSPTAGGPPARGRTSSRGITLAPRQQSRRGFATGRRGSA